MAQETTSTRTKKRTGRTATSTSASRSRASRASAKVTGETVYADDMKLPRMLHAKVLASPYAHARIRSIDTVKARQFPGVEAVVTSADLPPYKKSPSNRRGARLPGRRGAVPRPADRCRARGRPARRGAGARADQRRFRGADAGRRPAGGDEAGLAARPLAARGHRPLGGAGPRRRRPRGRRQGGAAGQRGVARRRSGAETSRRLRRGGRRHRALVAVVDDAPELHRATLDHRRLQRVRRAYRLDEHAGAVLHPRRTGRHAGDAGEQDPRRSRRRSAAASAARSTSRS